MGQCLNDESNKELMVFINSFDNFCFFCSSIKMEHMKFQLLLFFIFSTATAIFAQDKAFDLIKQGVQLHDKGDYKGAIVKYQAAVKLDKNMSLAYYEMALSYNEGKDYKNALKQINKVFKLSKDDQLILSSYLLKGLIQENQNLSKKSIKTYQTAIATYPKEYLLHYNLGFAFYNIKDFKNAELALQKALEINPFHTSSHYILGNTMMQMGLRVQSMMALSHFLFLENIEHPVNLTPRATKAYAWLKQQALGNIERTGATSININLAVNEQDEFNSLNTILLLMGAQDRLEADSLNLDEAQRMERFFYTLNSMVSESSYDEKSFWGRYYARVLHQLEDSELEKPYAFVILLPTKDDDVIDWINKNMDEIQKVEELLLMYFDKGAG